MDGRAAGTGAVRQELCGSVLLLIMARRPVNALTADLRASLSAALASVVADPRPIDAVVICSDIAQFSAGADLSEFGKPTAQPKLSDLCRQIENFPKPVVVAINGSAMGGGLELALAAHGRIALETAVLGLPDVSLGVVPAGGATQRLPRLIGAGPALKLMLDPQPLTAVQALAIGLLDAVVASDLRDAACAMAARMVGGPRPKTSDRRDGLRDAKTYFAEVSVARAKVQDLPVPAAARLVDCVEAAQLLSFDQGLAYEQAAFDDLVRTPEAAALRHAQFAERRATQLPASVAAQGTVKLNHVGFWGAADPAADVAAQALAAGLRVTLVDPKRDALVAALQKIATRQEIAVADGRLGAAARDADWARLTSNMSPEALVGADLVLAGSDAGPVPLDPPAAVLILGAADPAADVAAQALAAGLRVTLVDPKRDALVAALQKIATRQEIAVADGRLGAAARDADWARLTSNMSPEALVGADLVLAGSDAGPVPLDPPAAVLILGALAARAGAGRAALHPAVSAGLAAELAAGAEVSQALLASGAAFARRLGWKLLFTGPGGSIDRRLRAALSAAISALETGGLARPVLAAALASFGMGGAARAPLPAPPPQAKLVLDACLAALANQGARLLGEGVARRPSDIDAATILSGMFPRWQGGPMFQADRRGLLVLRADLKRRAETAPQIYAPDPIFDRLIADGRVFGDLNRAE